MRRAATIALLTAILTAGCVSLEPAHVPDALLGDNGWTRNSSASQSEPDTAAWGFAKSQSLVYEDKRSSDGHPGTLTVTTLRTLFRPSKERVLETVQERIRDEAERRGVRIEGDPTTGERFLANGEQTNWFAYDGSVEAAGAFFSSRNARVKVFAEVFECTQEKSVVALVALAQTTDTRSVGGVPLPSEPDPTTWNEIAADPRGTIEGIRGSDGLAYNIAC